jgi:predicted transposase YbfD/YdcC
MNLSFTTSFGKLEDPRVERTKKHRLLDIIAIAILGVMAGSQSFEEMEDFGIIHEAWLKQYLALENGIPSHDTLNRVFQSLCPEAFQAAFLDWVNSLRKLLPEGVVAIDGKTLCGSHDRIKGLKGLHVVSAWSCVNGLSLGQMKVADKSNEITAVPELLKQLVITGGIVTIDAMGCQREIAKAIIDQKADYVLAVKGNQGSLHEAIGDCFKLSHAGVYRATDEVNKDHGRIEERTVEVVDASILAGLIDLSQWSGIKSIAKLVAKRESAYERTEETRYYISSLVASDPGVILNAARAHWQIENTLHWSLDVSFREDDCRVRDENTALNLSWMRKMALSFLKAETSFKASIRRKQLKLWSTPDYLLKVLSI